MGDEQTSRYMQFKKVLALRGPNVWANFPVLEAWCDLGELKDTASNEIPGFNERLSTWLPTLIEHRCSIGERGGFFERLRRGTYLAHILEHVTLELQSLAGSNVGFGRARETSEEGVYKVVVKYENEELAKTCLESARYLCLAAVWDRPFDVAAEIDKLRQLASRVLPVAEVAAILEAARARQIPIQMIDNGNLMYLGYGIRRRRYMNGQTDRIGAVATTIAYDHELTKGLLQAVGVPVSAGRTATSVDEAVAIAQEVGLPVNFRSRYADNRGSTITNLCTTDEVTEAYSRIADTGWTLLVEHSVHGKHYRLLVVGDQVVAAVQKIPAPDQGSPDRGEDVLGQVHPEVSSRVVDAAHVLGLELATIEIITPDISQSLETQGGVVMAVQAGANLRYQMPTGSESMRSVGRAIVEHLFPNGTSSRIPIVSITGVNGKTTTTHLIKHLLGRVYQPIGMTYTEGIYVGGRRIQTGDCSGPKSARTVLQNPEVAAAVLEVARGGILREGLGFDHCDVAVVTNIGEGDHLGASDIMTLEQLARVKSTIVDVVAKDGAAVLNAADPLVVAMAEQSRGSVIYFARDSEHPVVVRHRAEKQGRAVVVRDGQIILAWGEKETSLIALDRVPLTCSGKIPFNVDNTLAAVAAAWALQMSEKDICAALETFFPSLDHTPGRFNLFDFQGVTVILDYGHNLPALRSLLEALESFPHRRRSIVYSAVGDRLDEDMIRQGELIASHFDRVILYEDAYTRGRKPGEIFSILRKGLSRGQRVREIQEICGALDAVATALTVAHPGELLVIQPDKVEEAIEYLRRQLVNGRREIQMEEAIHSAAEISADIDLGMEVRDGPLGRSVFATRAFQKGDVLLRAWGTFIPERTRHSIQVDIDQHILPSAPLRYLNHSCEPNCGLLVRRGIETIEMHALRQIQPGEELTLDYESFEYAVQFIFGPCRCNTPTCRGTVIGYQGLPPHLREAYGPYVAEYLREADVPNVAWSNRPS